MRLSGCGAARSGTARRKADLRDPELSLELRQLREVDLSDDVDDRQLKRLCCDDSDAVCVIAAASYIDVDICPLLQVVRRDDWLPAGSEELRLYCFDLGL